MKLKKDYVIQDVCGMQVAVSPDSNGIIKLTGAGAFIFGLLGKETTQAQILEALCKNYPDVDPQVLATDLNEFLCQVRQANLLSE